MKTDPQCFGIQSEQIQSAHCVSFWRPHSSSKGAALARSLVHMDIGRRSGMVDSWELAPSSRVFRTFCDSQATNYYIGPIHPRDKKPVGDRLAAAAASIAYGLQGPFTGPTLAGCQMAHGKITVQFNRLGPLGGFFCCRFESRSQLCRDGSCTGQTLHRWDTVAKLTRQLLTTRHTHTELSCHEH